MMKKIIALTCLISTTTLAASVDDLRLIAQDFKPYSYVGEGDKKQGLAIEVVSAVLKKAGYTKSIQNCELSIFSRSFVRINNDENTVFFPLAKTVEREKYFKWVGPISMDEPVIYGKKSKKIKITSNDDLKKYKITGKDGYGGVKQLNNMGIKSSAMDLEDSDKEVVLKLAAEKADLAVCNRLSCQFQLKDNGMKMKDYEVIYKLSPNEFALAFNKDTDDAVVDSVRKAMEDFVKTKEYSAILKKYGN